MKRLFVVILTVLMAVGLGVSTAAAKKRKKRTPKTPTSAELKKSLGDLKWGMSQDDLLKKLTIKVKEKYRPLVAKTHDAVEEDRLREEAKREIAAVREGQVEFKGRSNWDVSFIEGEYTHGNGETMLVVRDKNSQNFYFFINGKLWKWYKAFDSEVFPAGNFDAFAGSVKRKFGKAADITGELNGKERHWLEWQDKTTRLRAVDQTSFYGFYCLVFEDKATLKTLARLRTAPQPKRKKERHALVEAVTSGGSTEPDDSPNIVDRITGKIRKREQAPAPEGRKGRKGKRRGSSSSSSSGSAVRSDDDPLQGLGL